MNKKGKKYLQMHRLLAIFLSMCLIAGSLRMTAFAEETENELEDSDPTICFHLHDENCGYVEAVEGHECMHEHDESCGYIDKQEEVPCDMGCMDMDEKGTVIHAEGCAYRQAVEGQECSHLHDEACGYVEAVEGQPCGHKHDESCGGTKTTFMGEEEKDSEEDSEQLVVAAYSIASEDNSVCTIGENGYASLSEAINDAEDNAVIWMKSDDVTEQSLEISKSLTIELQGYSLPNTVMKISGSGTSVNLNDRAGISKINENHVRGYQAQEHGRCSSTIYITGGASVMINGSTGTSSSNGTIIYESAASDLVKAIFVGSGNLTINGGTFVGTKNSGRDGLFVYSGRVTINDGYFYSNCGLSYYTAPSDENPLVIKKGIFDGGMWIERSGSINEMSFSSGMQSVDNVTKLFLSGSNGSVVLDGSTQTLIKIGSGLFVSDSVKTQILSDGSIIAVGSTDLENPEKLIPEEGITVTLQPQILGGDGSSPISYEWRKDGNPIQNAQGSSYVIASYDSEGDEGQYTMTATQGDSTLTIYYQLGEKSNQEGGDDSGSLRVEVKADTDTTVNIDENSLLAATVTDDEQASNKNITVQMSIINKTDSTPDREKAEEVLGSISATSLGAYYDITLSKTVDHTSETISSTRSQIEITIAIPDDLLGGSNYQVIRVHEDNGVKSAEALSTTRTENNLTFKTDKFSTYIIAYTPNSTNDSGNGTGSDTGSGGGNGAGSDTESRGENGAGSSTEATKADTENVVSSDEYIAESIVVQSPPIATAHNNDSDVSPEARNKEPKTGDNQLPLATVGMIAGLAYLMELFKEKNIHFGMTEAQKNKVISYLVQKAKGKNVLIRYGAVVVIFVILIFYHSIVKAVEFDGQKLMEASEK